MAANYKVQDLHPSEVDLTPSLYSEFQRIESVCFVARYSGRLKLVASLLLIGNLVSFKRQRARGHVAELGRFDNIQLMGTKQYTVVGKIADTLISHDRTDTQSTMNDYSRNAILWNSLHKYDCTKSHVIR